MGRNNTRKKKRNVIYFLWHLNRNPKENKKKEHTERQLQAPFVFVFVFVFVFACMLLVIAILRVDRTREKKKTGRRTGQARQGRADFNSAHIGYVTREEDGRTERRTGAASLEWDGGMRGKSRPRSDSCRSCFIIFSSRSCFVLFSFIVQERMKMKMKVKRERDIMLTRFTMARQCQSLVLSYGGKDVNLAVRSRSN